MKTGNALRKEHLHPRNCSIAFGTMTMTTKLPLARSWLTASFLTLLFICGGTTFARAEADVEKSKDYPGLTRWPKSHITSYSDSDFDAYDFDTGSGEPQHVEGRLVKISYTLDEGADKPSYLKFVRNYENALKKSGWTVVKADASWLTAKLTSKEGREIWAYLEAHDDGGGYSFTVVEKGEMRQEVSASDMLDALNSEGHVALQINFDTGKATIQEESRPIIVQMIALMKEESALKV